MPDTPPDSTPPADAPPDAQQLEQQLNAARAELEQQREQLAAAEAQRDETLHRLTVAENDAAATQRLLQAGVTDLDAARTLLAARVDLQQETDAESIARAVDELLVDKPFLQAAPAGASLPPSTASPRDAPQNPAAKLADAARRAIATGNRRDVADYLRLRRQTGQG